MEVEAKKGRLFFLYIVAVISLLTAAFVLIANEMSKNKLIAFDSSVITVVQDQISPTHTEVMLFFTFLGSVKWVTIAVIVGTIFLLVKKKWSLGLFFMLASGIGSLFNILLKGLFKRARPDIHQLITAHGYSFPSGHSMGSFILYGSIAYIILHYAHRKGPKIFGVVLMAMLIFFIGTSRVYLGVHYPSDIVGGYLAGGAWLFICIIVFRYYEYRKNL